MADTNDRIGERVHVSASHPATLQDVADRSGVSRGTASRALTGGGRVSAETRARVIAAAEALDYATNSGARNLRRARAGSIGLWLPPQTTFMDYYMRFAFGVAESVHDRELTVSLIPADFPPARARALHVDGFVMSDVDGADPLARAILESGRPVVTSERVPPGMPEPSRVLVTDHVAAISDILDRLSSLGARSIAVLSPDIDHMWVREVDAGAAAWSAARGDVLETVRLQLVPPAWQVERIVADLFAHRPDVDAIVCVADGLAVAIQSVLRALGRETPGDVQLVSYVDSPVHELVSPAISALDQRPREAGARAGEMLVELLDGGDAAARVEVEGFEVVYRERGSTAPRSAG